MINVCNCSNPAEEEHMNFRQWLNAHVHGELV